MLEKVKFFEGLSAEKIQEIESGAERRKYKKGYILIGKGDDTDYLYVLISGLVHAYLEDDAGKRIIVNTISEGELFGELAMLSGETRSANIVTVEDCEVLLLPKDEMMTVIAEFPVFCRNVIQRLAKKVNTLTEDVSCLALMDNYGRIARVIQEHVSNSDSGDTTKKLTQQEIADRIGSSREMVSRILKDLRVGGYIEIENKHIRLLKALPKAW